MILLIPLFAFFFVLLNLHSLHGITYFVNVVLHTKGFTLKSTFSFLSMHVLYFFKRITITVVISCLQVWADIYFPVFLNALSKAAGTNLVCRFWYVTERKAKL